MQIDIPDNWIPTAPAINALPKPLRQFIHYLETNADPAEMVRENFQLRDQIKALEIALAEATGGQSPA